MTIGERIKSARKQAGMTQQELAERLEISYVGISLWESGKRKPKPEILEHITAILGLPQNYFAECRSMSEQEILDLVFWAWSRANYQAGALQHNGASQEEVERWERVCAELHKIHDETVEKQRAEDKKNSEQVEELLGIFEHCNAKGRKKFIKWAKEFAKIPEYQLSDNE